MSPGVVSEGGEVSDGGGGHAEAVRILKDNQSCFSLTNFPPKCKLCILVRKYLRNSRPTNYFISGRQVPPYCWRLVCVALISEVSIIDWA